MISWRYHVVSIVAVVLAFGLGILAGTSVVNDEFVEVLTENYDEAVRARDEALGLIEIYERTAEELQPILRDGTLLGEEAVVVTMEGADRPARRAVDELTAAGVDVLATIGLTRRLAEPELPENLPVAQDILGTTSTDAETLRTGLADALASRLAEAPDPDDEEDHLGDLLAEGFVTSDRDLDHDALRALGGQTVVLGAGGTPPAGLPGPASVLMPLTERLVERDVPVAVVGPRNDGYGLVGAIREASGIPDCSIVTVDDIDLLIGGIALVMGLDRLLDDPDPRFRPGGDYGVEADAMIPAGEPPASCRR